MLLNKPRDLRALESDARMRTERTLFEHANSEALADVHREYAEAALEAGLAVRRNGGMLDAATKDRLELTQLSVDSLTVWMARHAFEGTERARQEFHKIEGAEFVARQIGHKVLRHVYPRRIAALDEASRGVRRELSDSLGGNALVRGLRLNMQWLRSQDLPSNHIFDGQSRDGYSTGYQQWTGQTFDEKLDAKLEGFPADGAMSQAIHDTLQGSFNIEEIGVGSYVSALHDSLHIS